LTARALTPGFRFIHRRTGYGTLLLSRSTRLINFFNIAAMRFSSLNAGFPNGQDTALPPTSDPSLRASSGMPRTTVAPVSISSTCARRSAMSAAGRSSRSKAIGSSSCPQPSTDSEWIGDDCRYVGARHDVEISGPAWHKVELPTVESLATQADGGVSIESYIPRSQVVT
jgi:hypothetical protein